MSWSGQGAGRVSWTWFAAVVMVMVGIFNVIDGLAAAFSDQEWAAVGGGGIGLLDISTWGWIHVGMGALIALVGILLLVGARWARWIAIVLVVLNAVSQFVVMPVTPWWSVTTILLDVFVLWALIVHGDEVERV
jgi:hypothetical protein